ncbi:hypothetical protein OFR34_07970 [Brachyspira hyodysenteriae]|nr:hypothetical protein [Brachyspira hyodysenteriae]MDA0000887.1 hypothetical protein [Brachyspira hyodysenteriae]
MNLFIVFFATGLWHGASFNFVLWGLWHGLFLVIERIFLGKLLENNKFAVYKSYLCDISICIRLGTF